MVSSLLHLVGLRPRVYYTLTNFRGGPRPPWPPLNTPMAFRKILNPPEFIKIPKISQTPPPKKKFLNPPPSKISQPPPRKYLNPPPKISQPPLKVSQSHSKKSQPPKQLPPPHPFYFFLFLPLFLHLSKKI